ncbi:MAG TPA: PKD domain-containing protein, partial [Emticicia sp.]
MKTTLCILSILFVLLACQQNKVPPIVYAVPDATILVVNVNGSNTAAFTFRYNSGDIYTFDFGDGNTLTDSLTGITGYGEYQRIGHQYAKNGDYTVTLTIKNPKYTSQSQTIVEARRIAIADFSYEILANGQVKLKNLSENKNGSYKWLVSTYALSDGNYFIYTSGKEEPVFNFDLIGRYKINLQAINGNTSEVTKTIDISNAKNQMTFSGHYKGEKVNFVLNGYDFGYTCFARDGEIELIVHNQNFRTAESIVFWRRYYYQFDIGKEKKYVILKDYIKTHDTEVVQLEEETLDPDLYNNIGEIYSKALWVT